MEQLLHLGVVVVVLFGILQMEVLLILMDQHPVQ